MARLPRTRTKEDRPEEPAHEVDPIEVDEEFNYEEELEINPFFLDAEFLGHSKLFMKYARASAKANKAAKLAEERVKVVRSQLIKEANETLNKPTAPNVEAYYRDHQLHQKAKEDWIEATFIADLLQGAVFAFQSRKSALEGLVKLHGQEYFSSPQEPRDLAEASERLQELKQKSTRTKIRERMNP